MAARMRVLCEKKSVETEETSWRQRSSHILSLCHIRAGLNPNNWILNKTGRPFAFSTPRLWEQVLGLVCLFWWPCGSLTGSWLKAHKQMIHFLVMHHCHLTFCSASTSVDSEKAAGVCKVNWERKGWGWEVCLPECVKLPNVCVLQIILIVAMSSSQIQGREWVESIWRYSTWLVGAPSFSHMAAANMSTLPHGLSLLPLVLINGNLIRICIGLFCGHSVIYNEQEFIGLCLWRAGSPGQWNFSMSFNGDIWYTPQLFR